MILVHSIGRNDVQVVDPDQNLRWPIEKNSVQQFSQFLEGYPERWDVSLGDAREARSSLEWDPDLECLVARTSQLQNFNADFAFDASAATKPQLCCPLLRRFLEKVGVFSQIEEVVLLDTARQGRRDEPSHFFVVLGRFLRTIAKVSQSQIHRVTFLRDGYLEHTDRFGQSVMRPDCAKLIDDKLYELASGRTGSTVLVNDVGGMPLVRSVLLAAARYRFGHQHVLLARAMEKSLPPNPDLIAPEDSLNDRRAVMEAVKCGDFAGAARVALASQSGSDTLIPGTQVHATRATELERWRAIVVVSAQAMSGDFGGIDFLPKKSKTRGALEAIRDSGSVAVAALFVENAIRRGDLRAAILGTDRFSEIVEEELQSDFGPEGAKNDGRLQTLKRALLAPKWGFDRPFKGIRNDLSHGLADADAAKIQEAIRIAQSERQKDLVFWDLAGEFKFLRCPCVRPLCVRPFREGPRECCDLLDDLIRRLQHDLDRPGFGNEIGG